MSSCALCLGERRRFSLTTACGSLLLSSTAAVRRQHKATGMAVAAGLSVGILFPSVLWMLGFSSVSLQGEIPLLSRCEVDSKSVLWLPPGLSHQ